MPTRCFIDTNILVYAEASDDARKQTRALKLLRELTEGASGVLSTQVLKEYTNVALKKLRLPHTHIRAQLRFFERFEIVQITPALLHDALDLHQVRNVGFYDALIAAAAMASGCTVLYSEDFSAGELIHGLRVMNPFKD
jgi:predicted nucleic acid-binding protein